jgi:molecular chaperone DnaK
MGVILGIDLGTTNSEVAYLDHGRPQVIPSAEGSHLLPSVVAFTKDGTRLVGEPARRQAALNPEGTVLAIKRKMGSGQKVTIFGKEYTPQQISSFILQKMKTDAEAYLGEKIDKAVISVPAYFNDSQRQATKDAGQIAGLEVVRLINEPTAAAFAYGLNKSDAELKIMVFDFGGGTLDVTIMDFGQGVFEVRSTSGDTQLGGTDMDNILIEYICEEFKKDTGIDLRNDKTVMPRIREAAEKAKIELSTTYSTDLNLPFITADASGPKHLVMTLTRAKLESLVTPIVQRCHPSVERAFSDSKLTPSNIDKIILVGGPTRMPIVQKFVEDFMGVPVERGIDPMECVAMGAAIQAGVIGGEIKDVVLVDVIPLSLGIETLGGVFTKMIDRNTPIPTRKTQIFTTASDNQPAVEVKVLQGERAMSKDNISLGLFTLEGIPLVPRGIPQVEVTYEIDANGILQVSAKDKATDKENSITITGGTRLSKEDIDKMTKEAEHFAEEDRQRQKEVEIRNQADSLVYTGRKTLTDFKKKVDAAKLEAAEKSLNELEQLLKENKMDQVEAKMREASDLLSKVGEEVYRQAQQQQPPPPPGGGPGPQQESDPQPGPGGPQPGPDSDGKTIDGDYEVKS